MVASRYHFASQRDSARRQQCRSERHMRDFDRFVLCNSKKLRGSISMGCCLFDAPQRQAFRIWTSSHVFVLPMVLKAAFLEPAHRRSLFHLVLMYSSFEYSTSTGRIIHERNLSFLSSHKKWNHKAARRIDPPNATTRTGHHPAHHQQRQHCPCSVQRQSCHHLMPLNPPGI